MEMQHPCILREYLLNHHSGHTKSVTLQIYFSQYHTPQIILFLSRTVLIFSYILSGKTNTSFLINLKLKEIMYLNVSTGDYAIFQEHKVQKFSYNSYDDVGVF
jgi:hypothetical protein